MNNSYTLYKDKLKGEYFEVFDRIELYGITHNAGTADEFEERMMNLLDDLLSAQKNGKPAAKITGNDIEGFCRMYFEKATIRERLAAVPKSFIFLAWIMLIFGLLEIIITAFETEAVISVWDVQADMAPCIIGGMVGLIRGFIIEILITAARPVIFKAKWLTSGRIYIMVIALFVLGVIAVMIFESDIEAETPAMILVLASGGYIILYYVVKAVINLKKHGSVHKPKDKVSFFKLVDENVINDMPMELKKRYEKINEKNLKKGKSPVTPEEYMEKLRKEAINDRKGNFVVIVIIMTVCLGVIIHEAITAGLVNGGIMLLMYIVIEVPILKWCYQDVKGQGYKARILKKCDELGVNVLELADMDEI